mmetsp:Transcript_90956/g.243923  ORF Transcript_90956/g.243923 Transcript_90956/m.243923 type:complete len:239 (-) Transcript_90956:715-1431(-)
MALAESPPRGHHLVPHPGAEVGVQPRGGEAGHFGVLLRHCQLGRSLLGGGVVRLGRDLALLRLAAEQLRRSPASGGDGHHCPRGVAALRVCQAQVDEPRKGDERHPLVRRAPDLLDQPRRLPRAARELRVQAREDAHQGRLGHAAGVIWLHAEEGGPQLHVLPGLQLQPAHGPVLLLAREQAVLLHQAEIERPELVELKGPCAVLVEATDDSGDLDLLVPILGRHPELAQDLVNVTLV